MVGRCCIKAWSKTQSTIAKSSAESELLATVRGATEGIGLISLAWDLGMGFLVRLHVDASAALGIIERRGVGRVRHLDVGSFWIQEQNSSPWRPRPPGRRRRLAHRRSELRQGVRAQLHELRVVGERAARPADRPRRAAAARRRACCAATSGRHSSDVWRPSDFGLADFGQQHRDRVTPDIQR